MLKIVHGNIFESQMQTLTNPVNCVGVMGAGLALEFKRRYPKMFTAYQLQCTRKELMAGELRLFKESNRWILNFPTKINWRQPSRLEYIEQGLVRLARDYQSMGIESIALPPLGCGLGGLKQDDVLRLVRQYLGELPVPIEFFAA